MANTGVISTHKPMRVRVHTHTHTQIEQKKKKKIRLRKSFTLHLIKAVHREKDAVIFNALLLSQHFPLFNTDKGIISSTPHVHFTVKRTMNAPLHNTILKQCQSYNN